MAMGMSANNPNFISQPPPSSTPAGNQAITSVQGFAQQNNSNVQNNAQVNTQVNEELAKTIGELIASGNALATALASIDAENLINCAKNCGIDESDVRDLLDIARDVSKAIRKFYKISKKLGNR